MYIYIIDINTNMHKKKQIKYKNIYLLDSRPRNKNLIHNEQLAILKNKNIILPLPIVSDDTTIKPFWDERSNEISKDLWSSDKVNKKSSSLSIPYSNLNIINEPSNYKSLQFPQKVCTKNKKLVKISRKIKFFPSTDLKLYFNKCFGGFRYFYNKSVRYFNDTYFDKSHEIYELSEIRNECCYVDEYGSYCRNEIYPFKDYNEIDNYKDKCYFCEDHLFGKLNFGTSTSFIDIRNLLLTPNSELDDNELWQKDIPYDLRQLAIKDSCSALKSCISNKKHGNIQKFKLNFKSKNEKQKIFKIPSSFIDLKNNIMFTKKKKEFNNKFHFNKKTKNWIIKKNVVLNDTITILKDNDKYYMCATFDTEIINNNNKLNIVSCDPGNRNFLTLYSPDGIECRIGHKFDDELSKIGMKIDKLISVNTKVKNKRTRRNINKLCSLLRTKIRNKIDDLHWKTINFMCINFKTIVIPNFESSKKIKKNINRKINNTTVRQMLLLKHGKFLERLKTYSEKLDNQLIITPEDYTSKTCGRCGNIDKKLGSKEIYTCEKCNYKEDRDLNGARNILLKLISKISG